MFRKLDESVSVAGQIGVADVAEAARQGYRVLVNNRPDGEQPGQPTAAEIAHAAADAGLTYHAIPVDPSGLRPEQVEAMAAVLADAPGPVLAFCRSGTRSTYLWALASAARGEDPDELIAAAANAGYDLSPLRPALERR